MWADTPLAQTTFDDLQSGGRLAGIGGDLDIAVGGLGVDEDWQMAADGACDSRWALSLARLAALRRGRGPTYIRFAHEMNGDWHPWSVLPTHREAFIAAWRRWRRVQLDAFPDAWAVFCVAHRSAQPMAWTDLLPGTEHVDALGVSYYPNERPGSGHRVQTALHQMDPYGAPVGLEAHRHAARSLGVPLAINEWSTISDQGPNHALTQAVQDLVQLHAGEGPGQILYDIPLALEPLAGQL